MDGPIARFGDVAILPHTESIAGFKYSILIPRALTKSELSFLVGVLGTLMHIKWEKTEQTTNESEEV